VTVTNVEASSSSPLPRLPEELVASTAFLLKRLGHDPSDRRRHIVRLTPDGKRTLGRLRTLARRLEDDFLASLHEGERAQLHALLLRLAQEHLPPCAPAAPRS
jgi:hypothetical protein